MKKSVFLIFITIFFSTQSVYSFDVKNLSVTPYEFKRYIYYGLRTISQEIDELYFNLSHASKKTKQIYNSLQKITYQKNTLEKALKYSYLALKELNFLEKDRKIVQKSSSYPLFFQYKQYLELTIKEYIEEIEHQMFIGILKKQNLSKKDSFEKIEREIQVYSTLLFNLFTPEHFRKPFYHFRHFYLSPIKNNILLPKNRQRYIQDLPSLDHEFNQFSVEMTKQNYKLSGNNLALFQRVQRRWKSLLKISIDHFEY